MNDNLSLVLTHLDMALYGEQATRAAELDMQFGYNIPYLYHIFASVNLLNTLFLVDKKKGEPMGGYIYWALRSEGHEHLLQSLQKILDTPVGDTTFGDVIRVNRNKLMVHGGLALESLPDEIRLVADNEDAMEQWESLMEEFISELHSLRRKVQALV